MSDDKKPVETPSTPAPTADKVETLITRFTEKLRNAFIDCLEEVIDKIEIEDKPKTEESEKKEVAKPKSHLRAL